MADLLGQMAVEDYVDKLPILYAEFAEAAGYTKDRTHFIAMFSSAEDLMQKTPAFWGEVRPAEARPGFWGAASLLE